MNYTFEKLKSCADTIRAKTDFVPEIAVVLGSGLGDFAETIDIKATISYSEIEDFSVSTISGHKGRFVFGYVKRVPVVIMQGRVHYYEGYDMSEVVMPIRLMGLLGAKALLLTNAAGGINLEFSVGDFMLITGQISNFVPSPLIGPNIGELGLRFPDMSRIYDTALCDAVICAAKEQEISMRKGVYLQVTGPNYETPEEIKMFRVLGADAVGMSTACEAIAARHMGVRVCGISLISNMAAGVNQAPLSHEEVKHISDRNAPVFQKLIGASIEKIAEEISI